MNYQDKKISFFNNGLRFSFSQRTRFKAFLEKIIRQQGKKPGVINYVFCTDKELRKLNKEYLNHDYFTDILTFDLSNSPSNLTAEIFISVPRVTENAKQLNQTFKQELHRVMIHGILHLCGYKDKTSGQIKQMRFLEDMYLKKYNQRFM